MGIAENEIENLLSIDIHCNTRYFIYLQILNFNSGIDFCITLTCRSL